MQERVSGFENQKASCGDSSATQGGMKCLNGLSIMGIIAVMVVILAIFAIVQSRKQRELLKKYPGYPKGYWMNQGIGIGVAIGAGIGVALGSIPIGVGIGLAIGVAIGTRREKEHEAESRPMTDEEKVLQRQSIMMGVGTLLVGVIVFALTYFLAR